MGLCNWVAPSTKRAGNRTTSHSYQRYSRKLTSSVLLSVFAFGAAWSWGQVNVVTQHNDISRTGQNTNETLLNPANVNTSQFGLLFSLPVDGQIYAQPLYMSGLQIPGAGKHNVVFVATEHDSVYAFDADSNSGSNSSPLWQATLTSTAYGAAPGATSVPSNIICEDIVPEYGITGTPVIDPVAGLLYVVSFTEEGSSFVLRLHALSVTTGAEMLGGPVTIQAQAAGTGDGSSGGILKFDPKWENQRPGLLLLNGVLYVGFASHADIGDWHGWVLSYNPSTLAQIGTYVTSANGTGSGIWMSGDGLAADTPSGHPFGRMFISTGNGDFTATPPYTAAMDYGDSILNLDLTNGIPTIHDEFTPYNQSTLNSSDGDLGAGGLVILPDQPGTYPHLLFQEGKGGTIYLVNRDGMGGYNSTDNIVQEIAPTLSGNNGVWGGPSYWNGYIYSSETNHPLKAYSLANGVLSSSAVGVTPETFGFPGPGTATSSIGNTNGILWAVATDNYDTGGISILKAYDATNLQNELYSSDQLPARDSAGPAAKFAVPTIANGKVYVGTGGQLVVYGLFSSQTLIASPVISPASTTFTAPIQVTITDATPGAVIYYTTDGSAPSTKSTIYTQPFIVNSTQIVKAIAVAPGYVWINPVSATYTSLNNTANPVISPAGGTYSTSPTVTITDASQNASIYYTTDGSNPTTQSKLYTGPIAVTGSVTISAIAFAPGLSGSSIISQTYVTQSGVDFSEGFGQAQSVMTFNGSTGLDDSRLQLTNGYAWDTGSAFVTTPLNIQAFTTDFLFQLSNPVADGIAFVIQNNGPTALGLNSAYLGCAPMGKSIAIKFDFHDDAGEGPDSTGLYINGAKPTIPAIDLSSTGINLASGDLMSAHITYDGVNLAMTITDGLTTATWSAVWQVNIPQIVGGNTAYVGFTGSTQEKTASQKISVWTYTSNAPGQAAAVATPVIHPGSGNYNAAQSVTITDATAGATIYYTTDGTVPRTSSRLYSGPIAVTASQKIQAIATATGGAISGASSATFAISGVTGAHPAYSPANGFAYGSIILNGATLVSGNLPSNTASTEVLQLTDGSPNEAHSAYYAYQVAVQQFTSDFDFQLTSPKSEGFTFVVQNAGLNPIGTTFGYSGASIPNSVAVAFDINGTAGKGANSVLLYLNGALSTAPAVSLNAAGISLTSTHFMHAHFVYDGTNLTLTLTDTTSSVSTNIVFPVNIPAVIGGNNAYVGFTAASNGNAAVQDIFDWTFGTILSPTATPVIGPAAGPYSAPTVATITDATAGAVIYYTTDGTTPTAASNVYTGPLPIDVTAKLQAVAQAPQLGLSSVASAVYTIQSPDAVYTSGFVPLGMTLNGGATITGSLLQLTDGGKNEARSAFFSTPLNIQQFVTDFDFQQLNATADGFAFVIQSQGPTAVGSSGGGLGYGVSPNTGTGPAIAQSIAVKFDLYSNIGEGTDTTGLYTNGAAPALPATNLTPTGVVLRSGHPMHAHIVYDGANLTLTITDATTNASATAIFPVNIPAVVGGNTAYVGFTGGTGGSTATQNIVDWQYQAGLTAISYSSGFAGAHVTTNGNATVNGNLLQLTDGGGFEAGSAFFNTPVNIQNFVTDFDFQLLNAKADGFTFVIQNEGLNALGTSGGGLGYGISPVTGTGTTITPSVAVKFDIFNNSGEGSDSTGLYVNGAVPTLPATDLTGTGIVLSNGDQIHAHIVYDGTNLTLTLTDATTNASATVAFPVNVPAVVGANTAYVGFSGGTGGNSSIQNILDWTYQVGLPTLSYPSGFAGAHLALNGSATVNGTSLQLTDGGGFEAGSAYFNIPVSITNFVTDFDFQLLNAKADGFTFVIQNQGLNALGTSGGGLGYGISPVTGTGSTITQSVAVKFDIFSNSGEGADSTGIYQNGAVPTVPATNLTGTGVSLGSGDQIHAHIVYDGTNLTLTLTDATTHATSTVAFPVNIPTVVGANTAYVGFTAGTGGNSSIQDILDWTYTTH